MKVPASVQNELRAPVPTRPHPSSPRSLAGRLVPGLVALFLVAAGGCGVLPRGPVPVDRTGDPAIVSALEARLAAEPALDASLFRVESSGGIVLLYGTVSGLGQWNCALRSAHLVEGVVTVVDYLVIERGPREAACAASRDVD